MLLLAFAAATSGCSIKKIAVNKLGDSLASGGTTFASDDDPDLVGEALPFSLKLMESLLAESPQHRGLLLAASSGFTQYAFVYVQVPAEETEGQDLAKADYLRMRARKLYCARATMDFAIWRSLTGALKVSSAMMPSRLSVRRDRRTCRCSIGRRFPGVLQYRSPKTIRK